MAKKDPAFDDLGLDDDLFSDLDLEESDLGGINVDSEDVDSEKERSPIGHLRAVTKDLKKAGRAAVGGAGIAIATKVSKAMPEVGSFANEAINIASDVKRMKDDIVREARPVINQTKIISRQLAKYAEDVIPTRVYNKLMEALEPDNDQRDQRLDKAEERANAMQAEMSNIFKVQMKERMVERKQEAVNRIIDQKMTQSRHAELAGMTSDIRNQALFHTAFLKSTFTAYMKKTLELKYKHLFIAEDTLETLRVTAQMQEERLDAIRHNTSLPDSQKIHLLEIAKHNAKEGLANYFQQGMRGVAKSMFGDVLKRLKENVADPALEMLGSMNDMGAGLVDMLQMDEDMNGKKSTRGTVMGWLGGLLGGGLGNLGVKKLLKKIPPDALRMLQDAAKAGPRGLALLGQEIEAGNVEFKGSGAIQAVLRAANINWKGGVNQIDNKGYSDPNGPGNITNRFVMTVEQIIPGYLAKQTAYLAQIAIASGAPAQEELRWDWKKGNFQGKKAFQADLMKQIKGNREANATRMMGHFQVIEDYAKKMGTKTLAKVTDVKKDVALFIQNLASEQRIWGTAVVDIDMLRKAASGDFSDEYNEVAFRGMFKKVRVLKPGEDGKMTAVEEFEAPRAIALANALLSVFVNPNGSVNFGATMAVRSRVIKAMKFDDAEFTKTLVGDYGYGRDLQEMGVVEADEWGDLQYSEKFRKGFYDDITAKEMDANRDSNKFDSLGNELAKETGLETLRKEWEKSELGRKAKAALSGAAEKVATAVGLGEEYQQFMQFIRTNYDNFCSWCQSKKQKFSDFKDKMLDMVTDKTFEYMRKKPELAVLASILFEPDPPHRRRKEIPYEELAIIISKVESLHTTLQELRTPKDPVSWFINSCLPESLQKIGDMSTEDMNELLKREPNPEEVLERVIKDFAGKYNAEKLRSGENAMTDEEIAKFQEELKFQVEIAQGKRKVMKQVGRGKNKKLVAVGGKAGLTKEEWDNVSAIMTGVDRERLNALGITEAGHLDLPEHIRKKFEKQRFKAGLDDEGNFVGQKALRSKKYQESARGQAAALRKAEREMMKQMEDQEKAELDAKKTEIKDFRKFYENDLKSRFGGIKKIVYDKDGKNPTDITAKFLKSKMKAFDDMTLDEQLQFMDQYDGYMNQRHIGAMNNLGMIGLGQNPMASNMLALPPGAEDAEFMAEGGTISSPTLIAGGRGLAGEHGTETVVPHNRTQAAKLAYLQAKAYHEPGSLTAYATGGTPDSKGKKKSLRQSIADAIAANLPDSVNEMMDKAKGVLGTARTTAAQRGGQAADALDSGLKKGVAGVRSRADQFTGYLDESYQEAVNEYLDKAEKWANEHNTKEALAKAKKKAESAMNAIKDVDLVNVKKQLGIFWRIVSGDQAAIAMLSPSDQIVIAGLQAVRAKKMSIQQISPRVLKHAHPSLKRVVTLLQGIDKGLTTVKDTAKKVKDSKVVKDATEAVDKGIDWAKEKAQEGMEGIKGIWNTIVSTVGKWFSNDRGNLIDIQTRALGMLQLIYKQLGGSVDSKDKDALSAADEVAAVSPVDGKKGPGWFRRGIGAIGRGIKHVTWDPVAWAGNTTGRMTRDFAINRITSVFRKPSGNEQLSAKHLLISEEQFQKGVYFDPEGKERVKSVGDINRPVYTERGKPLINADDLEHGLVDADGDPIRAFGTKVGRLGHNAVSGLNTLRGKAWNRIKNIGVIKAIGNVVTAPTALIKSFKDPFVDVYLKDNIDGGPLITAKEIELGLVVFADGKPIKDSYSIDQPVYWTKSQANGKNKGKIAITMDHIKQGLVTADNRPLQRRMNMIGSMFGGALRWGINKGKEHFGLAGGIVGGALGLALDGLKTAGKALFTKKDPFIDVYAKDSNVGKPLITGKGIEEGKYVYLDGKPVTSAYGIRGAVYTNTKKRKLLISEEQLKEGLVDIDGNSLGKWHGRSIAGKLATVGFHVTGWALKKAWNTVKTVGTAIGNAFGIGKDAGMAMTTAMRSLFGEMFPATKRIDRLALEEIVGARLVTIQNILDARLPGKRMAGDSDGDGDRDGSYEDYKQKQADRAKKRADKKAAEDAAKAAAAASAGGSSSKGGDDDGFGLLDALGLGAAATWGKGQLGRAGGWLKNKLGFGGAKAAGKPGMMGKLMGKMKPTSKGKMLLAALLGGGYLLSGDDAKASETAKLPSETGALNEPITAPTGGDKNLEYGTDTAIDAASLGLDLAASKGFMNVAGKGLAKAGMRIGAKAAVAGGNAVIPTGVNQVIAAGILASTVYDVYAVGRDVCKWAFTSDNEFAWEAVRRKLYGLEDHDNEVMEDIEEELFDLWRDGDGKSLPSVLPDRLERKFYKWLELDDDDDDDAEKIKERMDYMRLWYTLRLKPLYEIYACSVQSAIASKSGNKDTINLAKIKLDVDKIPEEFQKSLLNSYITAGQKVIRDPKIGDVIPTSAGFVAYKKRYDKKAGREEDKKKEEAELAKQAKGQPSVDQAAENKATEEKAKDALSTAEEQQKQKAVDAQAAATAAAAANSAQAKAEKIQEQVQTPAAQSLNSSSTSSSGQSYSSGGGYLDTTNAGGNAAAASRGTSGSDSSGGSSAGSVPTDSSASEAGQTNTTIDMKDVGGIKSMSGEELAQQFANKSFPRGKRNNNPGNVITSPWTRKRPGYVDADRTQKDGKGPIAPFGKGTTGMARFSAPEYGIATTLDLIKNVYGGQGINTIRTITHKYSPPHENRTNQLIAAYSKASGFKPDEPINWNNQEAIKKYLAAKFHWESAIKFPEDVMKRGMAMVYGNSGGSSSSGNSASQGQAGGSSEGSSGGEGSSGSGTEKAVQAPGADNKVAGASPDGTGGSGNETAAGGSQVAAPKSGEEAIKKLQALGVKALNTTGGGGYKGVAKVQPELLTRFAAAVEDFQKSTGKKLSITSAWRSSSDQKGLQGTPGAGKVGSSPHQFGRALDIGNEHGGGVKNRGYGSGTIADQFEPIAKKYGLWRPYGPEAVRAGLRKRVLANEEQHFEVKKGSPPLKTPEELGLGENENSAGNAKTGETPPPSPQEVEMAKTGVDPSTGKSVNDASKAAASGDTAGAAAAAQDIKKAAEDKKIAENTSTGSGDGDAAASSGGGATSSGGTASSGDTSAGTSPAPSEGGSAAATATAAAASATPASGGASGGGDTGSTTGVGVQTNTPSQTGNVGAAPSADAQLAELKIISQILSDFRSDMNTNFKSLMPKSDEQSGPAVANPQAPVQQTGNANQTLATDVANQIIQMLTQAASGMQTGSAQQSARQGNAPLQVTKPIDNSKKAPKTT